MDGARWQARVQAEDFDLSAEVAALRAGDPGVGAVASFVGTVRDQQSGEALQALEIEHYPGMTEQAIQAMLAEAAARFELRGARIVHRVGRLSPSEQIVLVATASAHREQALSACAFLMDWLKTGAPFWKKAVTAGGSHWIEAKLSDDAAARRWGVDAGNAAGGPG